MPSKKPVALGFEEFMEAHPVRRGVKSWMEKIPEFEQVCDLYRNGAAATDIRRWLAADEGCGYGDIASVARVCNWLRDHVKRDPDAGQKL